MTDAVTIRKIFHDYREYNEDVLDYRKILFNICKSLQEYIKDLNIIDLRQNKGEVIVEKKPKYISNLYITFEEKGKKYFYHIEYLRDIKVPLATFKAKFVEKF